MGKRRRRNKGKGGVNNSPQKPVVLGPTNSGGRFVFRRHTCHAGPVHVFDVGEASVWAGTREEILSAPMGWDLIICLLGQAGAPPHMVVTSVGAASLVAGLADSIPTVSINWPDGDIPSDLPPGFWARLSEALQNRVGGNVGVYCLGGHGRTGTALSVLASLTGVVPDGADPVLFVRSAYCREAVETNEQCRYVSLITGREVSAEGSLENAWMAYSNWINQRSREALAALEFEEEDDREPVTNAAGDVVWAN